MMSDEDVKRRGRPGKHSEDGVKRPARDTGFGERLKLVRSKRGYSLRALEAKMSPSVSRTAIMMYEQGEIMPRRENFLSLCRALEVDPEYLMDGKGEVE